jgi:hypothetical protein
MLLRISRRLRSVVSHPGDRGQTVDDLLSDKKGEIERRKPEGDDDEQHIQIASEAVETPKCLAERKTLLVRQTIDHTHNPLEPKLLDQRWRGLLQCTTRK